MADDIQPDQETYDRLIAAGESERTARAKAKSVAIRRSRGANRASLQGDGQAAAPAAASEAAPAARPWMKGYSYSAEFEVHYDKVWLDK